MSRCRGLVASCIPVVMTAVQLFIRVREPWRESAGKAVSQYLSHFTISCSLRRKTPGTKEMYVATRAYQEIVFTTNAEDGTGIHRSQ